MDELTPDGQGTALPYRLGPARPALGLVVLQSDETVEADMRRLLPQRANLMVSRVPSGAEVTPETLTAMEAHLGQAAALFPPWARFQAIGYACTSGTAQIGVPHVAAQISAVVRTEAVTEPVSALIAACRALGVTRLGLISPYVAPVSARLRAVLAEARIETPAFASFEVAEEARVARIGPGSLRRAALRVAAEAPVEALFLSCTNLRTLSALPALERELGLPVLSSNQVLAWHMMRLAGLTPPRRAPGWLFKSG
ncbi:MAG: Asp/Glu racemase [Rhodobacteraceae bacterium]|jgi:maleate isomerase|uniref:Maleate isomerase n=1 Tax=Salipiger profundus TaxID=1229727 RepID=A0A1U7DC24_9RHOB|nr:MULTISPECIES: aspartate/glutamate racemase family protein [Salipiger]APX25711.1 maleate isomerase [Salipiger profundus]MAB06387.1 Asp/Glu racemase [Paracoccaceae bacterium]GGA03893.1 Asp/Glu racemase [Salipiger profundus]SFD56341.1 maleate isomerase [Salipiger profundus]